MGKLLEKTVVGLCEVGLLFWDIRGEFTLEQATKAQRGAKVYFYTFFNLVARWGCVVNTMPRPLNLLKVPVHIIQEAGWAPWPVWTCAENNAPTGTRSRIVQPVTSGNTDCAVAAHIFVDRQMKMTKVAVLDVQCLRTESNPALLKQKSESCTNLVISLIRTLTRTRIVCDSV